METSSRSPGWASLWAPSLPSAEPSPCPSLCPSSSATLRSEIKISIGKIFGLNPKNICQVLPEAAAGGPAEGAAGEAAGEQEEGGDPAADRPRVHRRWGHRHHISEIFS